VIAKSRDTILILIPSCNQLKKENIYYIIFKKYGQPFICRVLKIIKRKDYLVVEKKKYDTKESLKNKKVGAIFGYLVLCNNQIHDFQETIIESFFGRKEIPLNYFKDVISFKETAVSKEECYRLLTMESKKTKEEVFYYLVFVSEIDGLTDSEENSFFADFKENVKIANTDAIIIKATEDAAKERKKLKSNNAAGHTGKRANQNSTNNVFRITQKEYLQVIKKCQKTARNDYKLVSPITDDIVETGERLRTVLENKITNNTKFQPDVEKALKMFSESINALLIEQTEKYRDEMNRKGRAVNDFTISLIGRTKAGKSTLRAVLTGKGEENIGIGAQRTTRINNIYEWNHIRIIDTPGIDAGDDEDEQDKRIAEQVIGESDVICYIAASDGLPANAREFAVNIAKRNKPVIMLVNYKSNINSPSRFKRYIVNPEQWKSSEGTNRIDGYYKPIERLATENGVESLIKYNTVFLYAELLSRREEYKEYATVLRNSSGVDEFLANLKNTVVTQGPFLRSKTIIDDTATICNRWIETLDSLTQPIRDQQVRLVAERSLTEKRIKKSQDYLIKSVTSDIDSTYNKLAKNDAVDFVNLHYMEKENLSSKWKQYAKDLGFSKELENVVAERCKDFEDEIIAILNEVIEDLKISIDETQSSFGKFNGKNFPYREVFRFSGDIIALAGSIVLLIGVSNPIGWSLIALGAVANIISGWFKSKAKRQSEAKKKLINKIQKAIEEQQKQATKNIIKQIKEESTKAINRTINCYGELINGLEMVLGICDEITSEMIYDVNKLNIIFAKKILEYIDAEECEISNVERIPGKTIKIYPVKNIETGRLKYDRLNGLLCEEIVIVNN
jgi:small GTP-binding protein